MEESGSKIILHLSGSITQKNATEFKLKFDFLKQKKIEFVFVDFSEINDYDTYLVVYLNSLSEYCTKHNIELEFVNISDKIQQFIKVFKSRKKTERTAEEDISASKLHIIHIGERAVVFFSELYKLIEYLGELTIKITKSIFSPSKIRWNDFGELFANAGVYALPISALIVFLIGMVTGYQGASQLKQFGADIFIADLIGISLTRTLSPMLVAILVAGRSGSAYAAELGTMKVSEEIDALKSMGFDITYFLVLPRIFAVMLAMPILVIVCDFVGIAGGLISALMSLDITITAFINRLQMALSYGDVFTGVFKGIVFAFLISAIGCFKGLQAKGGASAVGKYTTSSVVAGVFLIILTDAIFTFLFQALGI